MSGFFPPWEITSVRADCLVELRGFEPRTPALTKWPSPSIARFENLTLNTQLCLLSTTGM
jgi:hypothetical protein